ncbi:MAG TPA: hypothetical protein VFW71_01820 [Actinomycetota bacterium]|nr:hypothetical protein [Actinomycetota bacterium]
MKPIPREGSRVPSPGPPLRLTPQAYAVRPRRRYARWYLYAPVALGLILALAVVEMVLSSAGGPDASFAEKAQTATRTHASTSHGTSAHPSSGRPAHGRSVSLPKQPSPQPPAPPPAPPAPSPSPSPTVAPLASVTNTVSVGSTQRNYVEFFSQALNAKVPALVVLMGGNASVAQEESRDGLFPYVYAQQAVLVYPLDYRESWNAGACCGAAEAQGVDDLGFIQQVVHSLQGQPNIGPIYLIGYSNGGKMAYDVACKDPGLVSSFAVIAAVPVVGCPNGAPISLLDIDGTRDPLTAFDESSPQHSANGFREASTTAEVHAWAKRNGCTGQPGSTTIGTVVLTTWATCANGTAVELAGYQGGMHEWPGPVGASPSAASLMWNFFTQPHAGPSAAPGSPGLA